jgi:hypothetical protein
VGSDVYISDLILIVWDVVDDGVLSYRLACLVHSGSAHMRDDRLLPPVQLLCILRHINRSLKRTFEPDKTKSLYGEIPKARAGLVLQS